ncbi:MAG: hypothetical protein QG597_90 [Actinomycetota bacterium]|nr:hypothetical protein [Actinomycetota bacterium]
MRVLMAAHPTVGHTQALRAIGRELRDRGHAIAFAVARVPVLPKVFPLPQEVRVARLIMTNLAADGFRPLPLGAGPGALVRASRIARSRGSAETLAALDFFSAGALQDARRLLRAMADGPADVVVADFSHFGAWLAADALDISHVAVFHSGLPFPSPEMSDPAEVLGEPGPQAAARLARGIDLVDRRVAAARRRLGLDPVAPGLLMRPYARGLNVLTTFEEFEPPRPGLAGQGDGPLLWAGPCVGRRSAVRTGFPWHRFECGGSGRGDDRPWVYVSLGTVFNEHPEVFRELIGGVHLAGMRAVVAAGTAAPAVAAMADSGDIVVPFAPQLELLDRVPVMISHGGNNSVNEALRSGTPLVVVPFGGEQLLNAARVEYLRVGVRLRLDGLSAAGVAEALGRMVQPEIQHRARHLAASVPTRDGAEVVADSVEMMLRRP